MEQVELARQQGTVSEWAALVKETGWKSSSVVWEWASLCSFDPIKDTTHDGMHLIATITRDLGHATVDVCGLLKIGKVEGEFVLDNCLSEFKSSMPSSLRHARR